MDRFEKDFRTMLGYFLKLFRHKKDVFRNETGTKQETKWKRNGNETEQKASKKKSALPVPCRIRFMLEVVLRPKTRPRRPKTRPRRHQDAPRRAQEAIRRAQDAPRGRQDAPRGAPRGSQTRPGERKWRQNGGKLAPNSDSKSGVACEGLKASKH